MSPQLPHFVNTLLFRITAGFLLLIGICLGCYYLWIENEALTPYSDAAEENWYLNLAADELDSLAAALSAGSADLATYGDHIAPFGAEVIVFDPDGRHLTSSAPDSLQDAVPAVPADLLVAMSSDDWDYGVFPDTTNVNAYVNRIFEVDRVIGPDGTVTTGYLVASYRPVGVLSGDLNEDAALVATQDRIFKTLTGLLIGSALMALVLMAWTGRRVQRLSHSVAAFAAGDLSHRLPVRSRDEIGILGRNFNAMAERIEDMIAELRKKEEFQRQLIANIGHDLRTPMASVRGYVETMLMESGRTTKAEKERFLNIIAGNLDHLERLVDHTLILSRFDSGQATFRMENFPPAELADMTLVRFEGLAAERDVQLGLEVGDGIALVHADPLQIAQVLQNLVENAIKFNRPGGRVVIGIIRDGGRIRFEVRDTGYGIDAADLPRIFDRFYTGDRSRTRADADPNEPLKGRHLSQNSGLGLAIAAKIVAGHDSVLHVDSRLGNGSVFHFSLRHVQEDRQDTAAD